MSIITLTTDFGELDYYVPLFKGSILRSCPSVKLIDISHKIQPFDINTAAYIVKNCFESFPLKSLHIIRVGENSSDNQRIMAVNYRGHYFIGPDNGVLSMIFEELPTLVIAVDKNMISLPNMDEYYCRAIKNFVFKGNISEIGYAVVDFERKILLKSVIYPNYLVGNVMHIDNYGNLITNISKEDFEKGVDGRKFAIHYRRMETIEEVVNDYSDVEGGDKLAMFNSLGYLEISINGAKANELFGINVGDTIKIEYR